MKIAIAVDDKMSLDIMTELLSEYGYQVISFSESINALEYMEKDSSSIDLFMIDVRMKGKNGLDMLSYLKGTGKKRERAPVIMISTLATEEMKDTALNLGASDYLIKPFDEWVLMQKIRQTLR